MTVTNADVLRPETFEQYIGQESLKHRLKTHIAAARTDPQRPLDHVLLTGPAGVGKTSLAYIIANALGEPIHTLTMPIKLRALHSILRDDEFYGVLYLDEIHAAGRGVQEALLPVLERKVYFDAHGQEWPVSDWMTVIASTTERDKLLKPFVDRFMIDPVYENYSDQEMGQIVAGMARKAGVDLDTETCVALGIAAGTIPRKALELVAAARDLGKLGLPADADSILAFCKVTADGLGAEHIKYLRVLDSQDGRAGEKTLQLLLGVPSGVLREIERLLLIRQMIEMWPSGREITPAGKRQLSGREARQHDRRSFADRTSREGVA